MTRSLGDFAKIVEVFDQAGVSFVSVTQQFNTTTSMGRLTLNVLLSFAQFEREIAGERIRDKIAASKKKGLWMGGPPPIGYDNVEKKLVVNRKEAETVRTIFTRYGELGSVRAFGRCSNPRIWARLVLPRPRPSGLRRGLVVSLRDRDRVAAGLVAFFARRSAFEAVALVDVVFCGVFVMLASGG